MSSKDGMASMSMHGARPNSTSNAGAPARWCWPHLCSSRPHPDLRDKLRRVDLMRYGHAMSIPVPGVRSSAALRALAAPQGRIAFAHSDLSAYSVFEEAFFHGVSAARTLAATRLNAASA